MVSENFIIYYLLVAAYQILFIYIYTIIKITKFYKYIMNNYNHSNIYSNISTLSTKFHNFSTISDEQLYDTYAGEIPGYKILERASKFEKKSFHYR